MAQNADKSFANKSCLNDLSPFFVGMALCSFCAALFLAFARSYIYAEDYQTGNLLKDLLINRFMECGIRTITTIPVFALVHYYKKKFSFEHHALCRTILSVIMFFYIICGIIMPFVETAISTSYEISDMMMLFLSAFIMFFIGETSRNMLLRRLAYVFVVIPWLVLGTYYAIDMYYQYSGVIGFSGATVSVFAWFKSICYKICPSLCYLIISIQIKKCFI